MANRLNVPKDLDSLVEKRETDERRKEDRSDAEADTKLPSKERRSGKDRRQNENPSQ
ncbi:MAG: hypothetical protein MI725_12000 [Pirellulales bacterium]|nr:hypothetical protein [Pirellulales bacterium]